MRELPNNIKLEFGSALNEFKDSIDKQITPWIGQINIIRAVKESIDYTLPGIKTFSGGLHPLTLVMDEIIDVFRGMGFKVETGPEAETVYYNFDALNTLDWHPARDLTDTFYLDVPANKPLNWVLRTETSPVQIRVMESQKPPIRIIAPGKTFRKDKPDASHSPYFMQVEGLYVDKGVTMADLKGTVLAFYRAIFGKETKTRFRPHFFPFTEPSAEVDVSCIFCKGEGCRVCKQSGWLEMGGSGMVNPIVLEGVGIDPEIYTGWAFGLGIERIAMFKYGVDDIRLFYENDIRFLEQF
jgi:phenylalanyl-tRNA synthetase alpha chain